MLNLCIQFQFQIKFGANAEYKRFYQSQFGLKDSVLLNIMTGSSAGVTEALIVSTPDLIKIRYKILQSVHHHIGCKIKEMLDFTNLPVM